MQLEASFLADEVTLNQIGSISKHSERGEIPKAEKSSQMDCLFVSRAKLNDSNLSNINSE
jgi:hypothetical protein